MVAPKFQTLLWLMDILVVAIKSVAFISHVDVVTTDTNNNNNEYHSHQIFHARK
jgi:hypothetical protein